MIDSISSSQSFKWLDGKIYWDPQRLVLPSSSKSPSTAAERGQHPINPNSLTGVGGSSQHVTGNDKDHPAASSHASWAQSGTRPLARRPSLRRAKRIPARNFPQSVRPRLLMTSPLTQGGMPIRHNATSLGVPSNAALEPRPTLRNADGIVSAPGTKTFNTGHSMAYPFRTGDAHPNAGEKTRPVDEVRMTGW